MKDIIVKVISNKKILKRISIGATVVAGIAGFVSSIADSQISTIDLDEKFAEYLVKKGIDA